MKNQLVRCFVVLCLLWLAFSSQPANAQTQPHSYLTLEILEEKIKHPLVKEGIDTVDLSKYTINLADLNGDLNGEFAQFYKQINDAVVRSANPLSFDFSDSIIQGDFQLDRLGINTTVGKGALASIFNTLEQEKINQYYPVSNLESAIPRINIFRGSLIFDRAVFTGKVNSSDSLFLQQLKANTAKFQEAVTYNRVFFAKEIDLSNSIFEQNLDLNFCRFFAKANFKAISFQGIVNVTNNQFEALAEFNHAFFEQIANFTRNVFIQTVDFSSATYRDRFILAKSKFLEALLLTNCTFEKNITLRNIYANGVISLRDVHLLNRIDFSNAFFTPTVSINASGLAFDSAEAEITGQSGVIGKYIYIERLEGNETVLRNLIRNFRSLEQVADANSLEYQKEQLLARQLDNRLLKTSWRKILTWSWLSLIPQWLILNLLLLLGDYGTNISLLSSIGVMAIAFFSWLFWLIDRYRPGISQPIIPSRYEIIVMNSSYLGLTSFSVVNIFIATDQPWLTLFALGLIIVLIPSAIVTIIYQRGRYHPNLNRSYFVENGEMREFRLLLGRLPIMPRFPFFRDRFQPLIWDKRWSWLNYYDLSLNNIFKLGFYDIRLRDRHLPGLVATLVWYQWSLGVLYIILLLWTLSRTIPGLNLLIYF